MSAVVNDRSVCSVLSSQQRCGYLGLNKIVLRAWIKELPCLVLSIVAFILLTSISLFSSLASILIPCGIGK